MNSVEREKMNYVMYSLAPTTIVMEGLNTGVIIYSLGSFALSGPSLGAVMSYSAHFAVGVTVWQGGAYVANSIQPNTVTTDLIGILAMTTSARLATASDGKSGLIGRYYQFDPDGNFKIILAFRDKTSVENFKAAQVENFKPTSDPNIGTMTNAKGDSVKVELRSKINPDGTENPSAIPDTTQPNTGDVDGLKDLVGANNPGHGCFLANTPIKMSDGTYKNIQDILAGENVVAFDIANNKAVNVSVTQTFSHDENKYLEIQYEVVK